MGASTHKINDPVYEEIRNKFWVAPSEDEARKWIIEADKYSVERHPGVFVVRDPGYIAWHPYIKGYSGETRFWSYHVYLSRMWVDNALKKKVVQ